MKTFIQAGILALGLIVCSGVAMASDDPIMIGKTVTFDYTLKVASDVIETTQGGQPLSYYHGKGQLVPGLEKALEGMKVGETKTVVVSPEDGYGLPDPDAFRDLPRVKFPSGMAVKEGMVLEMEDEAGNSYPATVRFVGEKTVQLDFNHPLAGKELTFDVKIVTVD